MWPLPVLSRDTAGSRSDARLTLDLSSEWRSARATWRAARTPKRSAQLVSADFEVRGRVQPLARALPRRRRQSISELMCRMKTHSMVLDARRRATFVLSRNVEGSEVSRGVPVPN